MNEKKSGLVLTLVTFLLVLVPVVIWAIVSTKSFAGPSQYDKFAQCLTESGAKMYGAYWCSHCQKQKKTFGSGFQYIKYFECSLPGGKEQTQECQAAKIIGYPTWEFGNGEKISGEITLSDLAAKSGCSLEGGKQK
jgi:hypothetical protein